MLEIKSISKTYGSQTVVNQVSLSIEEGEFFSLLGPSGCGKTTLLRMLGGFENPSAGEIWQDGKRIDLLPAHARQFNMVFQRYALFPHLSVRENLAFGLRMKRVAQPEIISRVDEGLALVRMEEFADRYPQTLSGGQQQRVALARALVNRPRVLLLDEPLSALDLKLRQQMQLELVRIQKKLGNTFIFVTHDQEEALTLSDRIAVMNNGVIEQLGASREVYENPRSAFVAQFIGSMNCFSVSVGEFEGNRARLTNEAGLSLQTSQESLNKLKLVPGQSVSLMIRPEKLVLSRDSKDPECMDGILEEVIFQGVLTQYLIQIKGLSLTATRRSLSRAELDFKKGDRIQIKFPPESIHLMQPKL
jgi:spermidine/putrescine transport system ATP-binding protein